MPRYIIAVLLLPCLLHLAREAACQHYYALRPLPSDALPVVELHEDPDPALDPGERDLNETELRRALGHFDARFLSASPPPPLSPQEPENNEHELMQRAGGSGDHLHAGKKRKRRRRLWLREFERERALCPVVQTWSDLGARFWPRYVRMGSCSRERSCSVPAGMLCTPAASTHVTLLRWRCARRGTLRCAWIRVHYPIITECKCSCSSS
ncbi:noggin-1-like [Astyanax mexicanus]|uniref:Noggin n=2 Tax=Astyanax mexicanus TaxID=7994 RepID=A0A3B1J3D4_ASTMX|nr:noggin-1-like [Astyanax mexicanus]